MLYSNKLFFALDINDLKNVFFYGSNLFQSGGIKAMDYSISQEENLIKITTWSDDKTVIYWNIKLDDFFHNSICNQKYQHITYSKIFDIFFIFVKILVILKLIQMIYYAKIKKIMMKIRIIVV